MSKEEKDLPFIALLQQLPGSTDFEATRAGIGGGVLLHESNTKETAPMVFTKISLKGINLRCVCGNPRCTLELHFAAQKRGHHPLPEDNK